MEKSFWDNYKDDDFEWAVIRLATVLNIKSTELNEKVQAKLLFSTVELLTTDRAEPPKMLDSIYSEKINESTICYFRKVVLTAKDAIKWYRDLENNPKTPMPSRKEDQIKNNDGIEISVSRLIDDPLWPSLGLPIENSLFYQVKGGHPAPFVGLKNAKIHRRFGCDEGFDDVLNNDKAIRFIKQYLHIDLKEYPEYLGSTVLIVPDPIIDDIDSFMIPAKDGEGEKSFYRFIPKKHKTLKDLTITFFDEQANLLVDIHSQKMPENGILEINKDIAIGAYGYSVTHPNYGILVYQPCTSYMRQIHFNLAILDERKIKTKQSESKKSPPLSYSAYKETTFHDSCIGEDDIPPNVNVRVGWAAAMRQQTMDAKKVGQRFFHEGTRSEAIEFIQELVSKTKKRIIIADPYFGELQLSQYIPKVKNERIKVIILTSSLAFNNKYTETEVDKTDTEQFGKALEEIKSFFNIDAEVKVLTGKNIPLHDRFLIIDNDVWLSGNSLNSLGDRASMIIRLPDPAIILQELEKMLCAQSTMSFDDYKERQIIKND